MAGGAAGGGRAEKPSRRPAGPGRPCGICLPSDWGGFRSPPVTPPPAHTQRNKNKKHAAFRALRDSSREGPKARAASCPEPDPGLPGAPAVWVQPHSCTGLPRQCAVLGSFVSLVPVWLAQLVVHKCVLHSKASRAAAVKDDPRLSFHFRDVGAKPPPLHTRTAHAPSLTY